jgi:hypothetical protein
LPVSRRTPNLIKAGLGRDQIMTTGREATGKLLMG